MITRALVAACLVTVLAAASAAAIVDVAGVHVQVTGGAVEATAPEKLDLWCNSPQATLALDNGDHIGFAGLTVNWHNLLPGAFVATPEGVVIGTSRESTSLSTALAIQPRERQQWSLHPNLGGSYHFAVLGETRNPSTGATTFGKLGRDIAKGQIQFAIHLGNAVTGGNPGQLKLFREQLRSFPFPTYVLPGNQDVTAGGRKTWRKLFGDVPEIFKLGKDRFVLLDNAFGSIDKPTLAWLDRTLREANDEHARHIFVFMHQPLVDLRPSLNQGMHDLDQIHELLRIFQAHRVHTVFAGHIPLFARETRNGVYYITTGGGGEPLAPHAGGGGLHHYVRVDVNGDDVKAVPIHVGN